MDWLKKTTDWQVCCLGQGAVGAGVSGGIYLFCFYSGEAGGAAFYSFGGAGVGVGGNLSGTLNPADLGAVSAPWSRFVNIPWVSSVSPFNTYDLNGAGGRISSVGANAGIVGYSATYITAGPLSEPMTSYFASQSVGGLGFGPGKGLGTGGQILFGTWTFMMESNLRP
jgi:hypothetical protein